jgi:type I restriction enzyme S subunit
MVEAMEIPKGFKKTEVGIIPSDWDVKKLSEIGESIIGLTYSPSNVKTHGTLVLRSSNVQNGKLAFKDNVYVDMDLPKRVIVKENDILICVRNGSRQLIGKCALIDKETAGSAFGAFMSIYRSDISVFAFHQFQSHTIQRQINETLGATINQITNKDLASFQITLPSAKAEQTAIATALNDADALITQLEKLIAKKRAIKQGAMQELLKPKEGWEFKKLEEIGVIDLDSLGYDTSPNYLFQYISLEDVDYGVLKNTTELTYSNAPSRARRKIKKGDILISTVRPNLKSHLLIKEDVSNWICSTGFSVLRCKENIAHCGFVFHHFFASIINDQIETLISGSSYPAINSKDVKSLKIPLPSFETQIRIAKILSDMDAEIDALEKNLAKYKMLKQGMMQNLLTGKIRLI